MKEIDIEQAESIMVGNTKAYYTPEQVNFFMAGYNHAVKKHNEKRKKCNSGKPVKGTVKPGECDASAQSI